MPKLMVIILIVFNAGLSIQMNGQTKQVSDNRSIEESLYRQLLQQVVPDGLLESRSGDINLRIDPRFLKSDPNIAHIKQENLYEEKKIDIQRYRNLIVEFHAKPANITKDLECLFSKSLPPPPDSEKTSQRMHGSEYCDEISNFVTLIFGVPRHGGAYFPAFELGYSKSTALEIDERNLGKEKNWYTVRAIEISSFSLGVYDLVFEKKENDKWKFIKKYKLVSILS